MEVIAPGIISKEVVDCPAKKFRFSKNSHTATKSPIERRKTGISLVDLAKAIPIFNDNILAIRQKLRHVDRYPKGLSAKGRIRKNTS
jgi:hypothetical protein